MTFPIKHGLLEGIIRSAVMEALLAQEYRENYRHDGKPNT
jgi:hypothetical protein